MFVQKYIPMEYFFKQKRHLLYTFPFLSGILFASGQRRLPTLRVPEKCAYLFWFSGVSPSWPSSGWYTAEETDGLLKCPFGFGLRPQSEKYINWYWPPKGDPVVADKKGDAPLNFPVVFFIHKSSAWFIILKVFFTRFLWQNVKKIFPCRMSSYVNGL